MQQLMPHGSHRVARWWTLGAGAACAVVAYFTAGASGLAGAAVGTALVVAFLSSGLIPVLLIKNEQVTPAMGLGVLLLTLSLRMMLTVAALVLLSRTDALDRQWIGATVVVTALTWISIHVAHAIRRSRSEPTIEPSPKP
jgi:hypothetical protein